MCRFANTVEVEGAYCRNWRCWAVGSECTRVISNWYRARCRCRCAPAFPLLMPLPNCSRTTHLTFEQAIAWCSLMVSVPCDVCVCNANFLLILNLCVSRVPCGKSASPAYQGLDPPQKLILFQNLTSPPPQQKHHPQSLNFSCSAILRFGMLFLVGQFNGVVSGVASACHAFDSINNVFGSRRTE